MELTYVQLDDRLDAVQMAEVCAPATVQRSFQRRFLLSWLYHELSLEGVILDEHDLERALAGREGRDYCDGLLLGRVRSGHRAIRRMKQASMERKKLNKNLLLEYQAILSGHQATDPMRKDSGATEAYKHDVVEPAEINAELRGFVADINRLAHQIHPVELAIQAHYRFIRIWPFEEHSAAVARLVANQILFSNGYPPALIHAHDRQQYYHALHYDISRLHSLTMESLQGQIAFRERLFMHYAPSHRQEERRSA